MRAGAGVLLTVAMLGLAACGGGSSTTSAPAPKATGWVDQDVTFTAGGLTIYASYRHPAGTTRAPAALLIAGSGPADRNGDETGFPENSLGLVAGELQSRGVASLRYDKLYSGRTGAGGVDPATVTASVYTDEAAAALRYLAAQPRTDPAAISVYGHSEGALYALLLATAPAGSLPHVTRLGLLEPLSRRFLDVAGEQLGAQLDSAGRAGRLTPAAVTHFRQQIAGNIAAVRAGNPPGPYPGIGQPFFGPSVVGYIRDVDRYDPAVLAAHLPAGTPVLLTCSSTDSQVFCSDVDHLDAGLRQANTAVDFVHLSDVDHGLKADTSTTGAKDTAALPMAPPLAAAMASFAG